MVGFDDFRGVFQPKMILNSDFPHNTRYQGNKYLQLRRALQITSLLNPLQGMQKMLQSSHFPEKLNPIFFCRGAVTHQLPNWKWKPVSFTFYCTESF